MSFPAIGADTKPFDQMADSAQRAAELLKSLSHEGRLRILCHLATGEKSVGELESLLSARQAAVSQQLARLRQDGLVAPRRDGKTIFYRLADPQAHRLLDMLCDMFCGGEQPQLGS